MYMQIRKIIREGIAFTINLLYGNRLHSASILMYHSIGDNDKFSTVTPKNFERQLQFLKKHNYTLVTLHEIMRRKEEGETLKNCVAITFDDGYRDFYTTAFPLLKKYNVPAAVFVVTGNIGGMMRTKQGQVFPIISRNEIIELKESGLVHVYPHTKSHPRLSEISTEEAIIEIETSRNALEDLLGIETPFFAYPFGVYTDSVVDYLQKQEAWKGAVTVVPGLVSLDTYNGMLLKRNMVDSETGKCQFRMKVSDGIEMYTKMHIKKEYA